jgi:hypothetical protein
VISLCGFNCTAIVCKEIKQATITRSKPFKLYFESKFISLKDGFALLHNQKKKQLKNTKNFVNIAERPLR